MGLETSRHIKVSRRLYIMAMPDVFTHSDIIISCIEVARRTEFAEAKKTAVKNRLKLSLLVPQIDGPFHVRQVNGLSQWKHLSV